MDLVEFNRKPLLHTDEIIKHLLDKGVTFNHVSQEDAMQFLNEHNNFFKLSSYRKNYVKQVEGLNLGHYINLDFAYLIDISTIDMHLRYLLLKMCLDIEHFIKLRLLKLIEHNDLEDGYSIVVQYIESQKNKNDGQSPALDKVFQNIGNPYCGDLLKKHRISKESVNLDGFPVWAFVEVIPFGTLKDFYNFYHTTYGIKDYKNTGFLLTTVNQLRNAVAHSNCILNYLYPISNKYSPDWGVLKWLSTAGVGKRMRDNKMNNPRIRQIVTMLYVFENVVTSRAIRVSRYTELSQLINGRTLKNATYYRNNYLLRSTYRFFRKVTAYLSREVTNWELTSTGNT